MQRRPLRQAEQAAERVSFAHSRGKFFVCMEYKSDLKTAERAKMPHYILVRVVGEGGVGTRLQKYPVYSLEEVREGVRRLVANKGTPEDWKMNNEIGLWGFCWAEPDSPDFFTKPLRSDTYGCNHGTRAKGEPMINLHHSSYKLIPYHSMCQSEPKPSSCLIDFTSASTRPAKNLNKHYKEGPPFDHCP